MIKTFKCQETQKIFYRESSHRFPANLWKRAHRKLRQIHASSALEDLRVPPGNHLEALSGNRLGQYSIRINKQWRICFEWQDGNAYNVEIVDYH